jgi:hypothetical protein
MNTVVVTEAMGVARRLQELGLDVQTLHDALRAGLAARNECTDNDPPGFKGIVAWGRTVRRLRELKIPHGWQRSNALRLAAVSNEDRSLAIAVSTGDERTGLDGAPPQTRYAKGPAWAAAVESNMEQLGFPGMFTADEPAEEEEPGLDRATWVLLFFVDAREIRCELSLPRGIGPDEKLDGWEERIILPAIPLEPETSLAEAVPSEPIDVPVTRRAG